MRTVILEAEFSSAHFYHQPEWTAEKNKEVFGRCFTEFGHGHNYLVKAEWADVADSEIPVLRKNFLLVLSVIDHEHLNFVIPEFKEHVPTTEMILEYLKDKITSNISFKLLNLELFEAADIGARLF